MSVVAWTLASPVHQHLDDLGELIAQEDGHDRRRRLVGAQTVVVAAARDAGAQEILVLVDGLDDRSKEHHELQVLERGVAGVEEVFVGRTERPVVVLARTVDALERLLVQQAHQIVAAGDELHLLHHEEVVVNGLVELGIHGREFVLARRHLVVLRLGRDAQCPKLVIEVLHVRGDGWANGTEIVLFELLALARSRAEQRAAADNEVAALTVCVLLDEEVLLLVAHGRHDALGMLAEQGEYALGLLVEGGHGAQQRGLLIQRLAGVGAKRRGGCRARRP